MVRLVDIVAEAGALDASTGAGAGVDEPPKENPPAAGAGADVVDAAAPNKNPVDLLASAFVLPKDKDMVAVWCEWCIRYIL